MQEEEQYIGTTPELPINETTKNLDLNIVKMKSKIQPLQSPTRGVRSKQELLSRAAQIKS
jgi:hypothetical protein